MAQSTEVDIGPFSVGGDSPHFLIAGPCVIESEGVVLRDGFRNSGDCQRSSNPIHL